MLIFIWCNGEKGLGRAAQPGVTAPAPVGEPPGSLPAGELLPPTAGGGCSGSTRSLNKLPVLFSGEKP